ncbi:TPA: efflux RND transporter permease subunit [Burkholderia aenigmatica]|uniref:efflux RND transporter permease subunit n=1 Tax=Burkholderia sp. AU45251 TaxID=3059204 RepID=UPI00264DE912|nr:efflux RND transporter permease subunit [Burkholderia sp. AU45251]HDR9482335.1 efflux RND transporter permease subunit [Burkholderia aenigmatica]MDN7515025.1 efflux RND transporter permease subunit [Burkholderia sp. AU45251]HDR9514641.1 efflux RND transporter permease subunit [Burkholderia aenigmatica]HDR9590706.1 efflux RND transporter permease subunit [Burkholderia aenigmatica]HDR9599862.1 efflux RND transporter permease subunit [Burkholderia aenigmatica]
MLNAIIRFSLRFRGIVYALAVLAAGYGLFSLTRAKLDVFPEFAPPMSIVQIEAPGLTSEQVETLVTQPVENGLGGMVGLQSMRSRSMQGLSSITLVFDAHANVLQIRQLVSERVNALAATLPAGVLPPRLLPLTTTTSVVRTIGLTSKTRSLMDLYDVAQWVVRPQLMSAPGVADAIVFGGQTRQLQIQVDPAKLMRYGLSIQDVIAAARQSTGVRGAGFIENDNQRIAVNADGQIATPEKLAGVVLRWSNGVAVRLSDVAAVTWDSAPAVGAASIMGQPGVMLVLESQYGTNTRAVTNDIDKTLAALRPVLAKQGVDVQPDVFRPAKFIDASVGHLRTALLVGAVLVIAVLFLFLLNVRTALISAVAIPLSLLVAIIVLVSFGVSLNTMTLGGLAIALGEVVDDAIIDVENIYRRLRENRALSTPLPVFRVVLRASLEVRSAVVFATFIVMLIFLPVLTLSGVAGKLFAPLGIAYILAVLASLGVALTLTPAMALALLTRGPLPAHEPRLIAGFKKRYTALLLKVEQRVKTVMIVVALMCVAALASLPFMGGNFIPELREGHYIVHMGIAPGTSLAESMRIGAQVTHALMQVPGVRLVAQRAGRANEVVDPMGVQLSEFEVDLEPMSASGQSKALHRIQQALGRFPGLTTSVNTFLVERIDETISGVTAPVVVNVFGDNLDVIDRKAQEIARLLGTIHGVASVGVESPPGIPELDVRLKPDQLSRWGFRPVDVLDAIQSAYQGATASQVYLGSRTYDVVVILSPDVRRSFADVGALMLRNPDGLAVPLRALATIGQVSGHYQITHDGGRRMQTVSVTLGSRAVSDFVKEAQARVSREVAMPAGTYAVFSGESEARSQSQHDLLVYGAMSAVGIALLLFLAMKSRRGVVLVMVNLPFALVGGVLSVALAGGDLSLGSMVGFVTLFGISLRNSIMLISHYEHLVHIEGMPWGLDTAVRGASERLIPILMTALVTALALMPLALTSGAAGNEIEGPMAIVILGGLITSTALNLIVLPTLALRYGRFELDTLAESSAAPSNG